MSEEPVEPTPASPSKQRADQDRVIANGITLASQQLAVAQHEPEVAAILAARGYAAVKVGEGVTLQQTAQIKFNARQTAMYAQNKAGTARDAAEAAALKAYVDFRGMARSVFPEAVDQMALGVGGDIARDTQQFITDARASYAAARLEPHASTLATYGYDAAAIAAALATVDAFQAAATALTAAVAEAGQARAWNPGGFQSGRVDFGSEVLRAS